MTSKKRWSKWVLILPLLFAANSAATAATTVTHLRLKGDTVTAVFLAPTSADGCIVTFVSVAASDLIEKVSGNGSTTSGRATAFVVQTDVCQPFPTDFFVGDGEGTNIALKVSGNAHTATLAGSIQVFDIISLTSHTLEVNLTWKATGEPEFTNTKETFKDPELGIKIKSKSRGIFAEATASGTVMGLGQNLTPEASDEATLQKNADVTLTIEKTH
jgi:hypothetical protein